MLHRMPLDNRAVLLGITVDTGYETNPYQHNQERTVHRRTVLRLGYNQQRLDRQIWSWRQLWSRPRLYWEIKSHRNRDKRLLVIGYILWR